MNLCIFLSFWKYGVKFNILQGTKRIYCLGYPSFATRREVDINKTESELWISDSFLYQMQSR